MRDHGSKGKAESGRGAQELRHLPEEARRNGVNRAIHSRRGCTSALSMELVLVRNRQERAG